MTPLDAALRYAAAGFKVIPVSRKGKIPLTPRGAHDSSNDEIVIQAWWERWPGANIGLVLDGLVAVDIDPRHGGDVDALPHPLPETCFQKTGGGGWHYLFRAANGTRYPGHLAPGIDCKSGPGAYIVVEPSVHASGERYVWLDETEPWTTRPAEAPEWLAAAPNGKREAAGNNEGGIPEGKRNAHLTSLGGSMRRRGMSRESIEAALLAENQARCDPPLPDEEVQKIAESVGRYEPRGGKTEDDANWPAPLDLGALARREPTPPRHIIPDWLPAGEVALLAGHGGSGKSQIALHLAVCVALGRPWCGLATERRPVTYVSAEDGADILHWRLTRLAAHLGVTLGDLADLRIIDASQIEAELMREIAHVEPMMTAMYETLAAHIDPAGLVILDGTSDLYGASEIIRRHVRRYVRALRRLVNADGAVLLLAHIDKAAARDGATSDRYSGSTAWHNSVRARWALTSDPEGGALTLTLAKTNNARPGAEIRFRWDAQAHLYVAEPTPAEGGIIGAIRDRQHREAILTAMRACAEPIPAATTGQRTAWHVLSARPELPAEMRDGRNGRRLFWRRIEELRQMGAIREASYRRSNRHILATLELSTEGCAECAESE